MIDLKKLAGLMNNRNMMRTAFKDMSKEDILYLCKAVISCQEPGYIPNDPKLISCYKHNWWVVYRKSACSKCNDKESCPSWTE